MVKIVNRIDWLTNQTPEKVVNEALRTYLKMLRMPSWNRLWQALAYAGPDRPKGDDILDNLARLG